MAELYTFDNVTKVYDEGGRSLEILKEISISVHEGKI